MKNSIPVGLGEVKVSENPDDVLVAYGLGSCVGISLYAPQQGFAALLHAVLPENNGLDLLSPKFVDSGINALIDECNKRNINLHATKVTLVGGANMLAASGLCFDIGERNIIAAKNKLHAARLRITSEEIGGSIGRTMRIYVENGRVTTRSLGNPEQEI